MSDLFSQTGVESNAPLAEQLRPQNPDEVIGQQHLQVGEHAGQQLAIGVGQAGAHLQVAGAVFNFRVDGADLPGEHFVRVGRHADFYLLTNGQQRHVLFGQEEVDKQGGKVL